MSDEASMKISVDYDRCEANAICVRRAPDLFSLGDDDRLHLLVERPDPSQRAKAEDAVRRCPRGALSLVEG